MFGEGISKEGELVDYGVKLDIIDKSGAWFSYNETKLGQGRENVKAFLKENKELAIEIEEKIKQAINGNAMVMACGADDIKDDE